MGVSIGVVVPDAEAADGLLPAFSIGGGTAVTLVMMRFVSFAARAALSFARVAPEGHVPLSRWWSCADGQVKRLLQFVDARQVMLLRGWCFTEAMCWASDFWVWNVLLHFLHLAGFGVSFLGLCTLLVLRWALSAVSSWKSRSQSQQRNWVAGRAGGGLVGWRDCVWAW